MLERLREQVLEANLELVRQGLVRFTFGNASAISRKEGLVVTALPTLTRSMPLPGRKPVNRFHVLERLTPTTFMARCR
jgi:hypothetical protein